VRECRVCPRECGANRIDGAIGFCGSGRDIRVARCDLHFFEEPPISGIRGSGTIFFVGCSLRCVFCQNRDISREGLAGRTVSRGELGDMMLQLQDRGAHNINLVTPTHFAYDIAEALESVRDKLHIPVAYNTSGYEKVETLRRLEGLIDIYMPDFKYMSSELSDKYSSAPDYAEVASAAITEMYRQVGKYRLDEEGILQKGLLVRHLVLPSHRKDSIAVIRRLAEILPVADVLVSIMSQYTPEFASDCQYKELHRRVTSFEYDSVVKVSEELGFRGFMQGRSSATSNYTPEFNKENK